MPKRHRRRASAQNPASLSCHSISPSDHAPSHATSEGILVPPEPALSPSPASLHLIPSCAPSECVPSPPPPANPTWLIRDCHPWGQLLKPVEPSPIQALPTPSSPTGRPLSAQSLQSPSCIPSDAPSRPPSVISCSSHSSSDSEVLLQLQQSKSSNVTSISIPPSGSTRVKQLALPSSLSPRIPYYAPIPIKKIISPLSSMCSKTTRHSTFYFPDDLVTLNVDDCLFRVHKNFLERESTYFRKLFIKEAGRGLSDETAIELPQVTSAAFEHLLKLIYLGIHEPCSYTVEAWISLLAASTSLSFPRIRERALAELESESSCLDAVDRIILADRYDVDQWRAPAYIQLCTRDRPIQESEATLLGVKVTSQLAEIREKVLLEMLEECQTRSLRTKSCSKVWAKPVRDAWRVEQMVNEVFWPHEVPSNLRRPSMH
ncbi:hypothetical protein PHLGIDRAFT_179529 [Phlebiopsis gigantea 11061_1 CR5-6]|uniref:BTB domain-containing protein n=1 Tax=Phlebiopsis gigantea (strain 11061_1 CR5-6) TaxID=745531 RepID=A0A0C3RUS0_PHLG1|nr:hypothetical protein PHLGIDRAFT_179529 [Phlebiopsis gigantea 11061_1 CR5-6]